MEVKPLKLPSGAENASENETSWNKETSCVNNYSRNGLVSNANRFYYLGGRNALADNVRTWTTTRMRREKRKAADKTLTKNADRDELRKAVGERSSSGIAKPTIDAETEENLRTVDVKTRQRRGKDVSRY